MDFKYKKQETYTQAEVDALLDQHAPFVKSQFKGYASPEEVKALQDELTPYKAEKRHLHISSLVKDLTDSDKKLKDAIALAGITEEDSDEIITNKVTKVIEDRAYLQKDIIDDKKSIEKKPIQDSEPKKTYRFAGQH